ncbi:hypothetical protein BDK51DRAFT_52842 [Blyttiomyces helicus]|uniref:Uncharacterized protein n=1 Tax=Blyttiomyces helicus TaxID=388810 RepID=A0A4P9W699_9FUNG|nr:hypothetical protein BDK51DRAFT_52842 [Blyttiomyces helicus]|eukprot:RKO86270.1 hypothetical protein BDK51DRAFT_52842 [Blyttiomyces helicus]
MEYYSHGHNHQRSHVVAQQAIETGALKPVDITAPDILSILNHAILGNIQQITAYTPVACYRLLTEWTVADNLKLHSVEHPSFPLLLRQRVKQPHRDNSKRPISLHVLDFEAAKAFTCCLSHVFDLCVQDVLISMKGSPPVFDADASILGVVHSLVQPFSITLLHPSLPVTLTLGLFSLAPFVNLKLCWQKDEARPRCPHAVGRHVGDDLLRTQAEVRHQQIQM